MFSDLREKKVLVIGGSGHLGSAFIHYLIQEMEVPPYNIRVFYLPNTPTTSLSDIEGLDLWPGDICQPEEVKRASQGIDYVFHMAGSTTFGPRKKRRQWLINVEGTRNVLEAAKSSSSVQKVCYTSTVNALGVPNPPGSLGNFENSDPYLNLSPLHSFKSTQDTLQFIGDVRENRVRRWEKRIGIGYFDSKLAAQELVTKYVQEFRLNVVSVLPGTFFGPYDYLIGNGIYLLALYQKRMPGVLGGGLSLAHVMDVVEGHLLTMELAKPGSRYIITGRLEDNLYFKDMVKVLVEVMQEKFPGRKFSLPSRLFPACLASPAATLFEWHAALFRKPCLLSRAAVKAGSMPLFYTFENAKSDLGYTPRRTFRKAVEEMCDYYSEHRLFEAGGRYIDQKART